VKRREAEVSSVSALEPGSAVTATDGSERARALAPVPLTSVVAAGRAGDEASIAPSRPLPACLQHGGRRGRFRAFSGIAGDAPADRTRYSLRL
jgi:hypothetical protein